MPWQELCVLMEPLYPKGTTVAGRPRVPFERMPRIYFPQPRFILSDPAMEEALYVASPMHAFTGIYLGQEPPLDETTTCKSRHLLE